MGGAVIAAAAAQKKLVNAVRAFGTIVTVEPEQFLSILSSQPEPLVVVAEGGFFKTSHQYLTSYKGLAFFAKSPEPLALPASALIVNAISIKIPD